MSTVYAGPDLLGRGQDGKAVMRAYRDFLPTAPEDLGIFVGLKTVPPIGSVPEGALGQARLRDHRRFNGPAAEGERLMAPLLDALPPPLFNWMGEMPFPAMQRALRSVLPEGAAVVLEGRLRQDAARRGDRHAHRAGGEGAERVLPHAPVSDRRRRAPRGAGRHGVERRATRRSSMVIAGIDPDPKNAEALKTWGRGYWKAVHPFNLDGAYVNFMMDDEADGRVQATYGENYARLAEVKATYDPKNLFRVNQNIKPA